MSTREPLPPPGRRASALPAGELSRPVRGAFGHDRELVGHLGHALARQAKSAAERQRALEVLDFVGLIRLADKPSRVAGRRRTV
jgi:hypothetical protein